MFVKLNKLEIQNTGRSREYYIREIFINTDTVVSVTANQDITNFLRTEAPEFENSLFSNVVVNTDRNGQSPIVVMGSPTAIVEALNGKKKEILHD